MRRLFRSNCCGKEHRSRSTRNDDTIIYAYRLVSATQENTQKNKFVILSAEGPKNGKVSIVQFACHAESSRYAFFYIFRLDNRMKLRLNLELGRRPYF